METKVSALAELQKRVRTLIDREVTKDCFDVLEDTKGKTVCRNINYAKTVFRLIGGSFTWLKDDKGMPLVVKTNYEDDEGKFFVYEAYGRYTLPTGEIIEQSGMFSSRDKFFGKKAGEFKATSEVDERFIRQAAQTECFKKCIFTALGYGELSGEEAAKAGAKTGETTHKFDSGKQGGSTDTQESKDARAEIEKICRDLFDAAFQIPDAPAFNKPEDILQAVTANVEKGWYGWKSFQAIKDTQLPKIAEKLRQVVADFEQQQG
jgi:hypothetical protein